jgi:streptomycin 6-kinase
MLAIAEQFSKRIVAVHGKDGERWLAGLNSAIAFSEKHWGCKVLQPFKLSYNYVAPVLFRDGRQGVLKLCPEASECINEIETLQWYHGEVLCKMMDCVASRGIILLEQLSPGTGLNMITDERKSIEIAVSLIMRMRVLKISGNNKVAGVSRRFEGIERLRKHFRGSSGLFPEGVVAEVERLLPLLIATQKDTYLLHGDFHHENILSSGPDWKLIDPKAVHGEVEYELIPFLLNNLARNSFEEVIANRIDQFANALGINPRRIYDWGLCHGLLSAWWNIEDNIGLSEFDLPLIDFFFRKSLSSIAD